MGSSACTKAEIPSVSPFHAVPPNSKPQPAGPRSPPTAEIVSCEPPLPNFGAFWAAVHRITDAVFLSLPLVAFQNFLGDKPAWNHDTKLRIEKTGNPVAARIADA